MLAHGPEGTRISDIILAVDEPIRATRCSPGQPFGCRSNNSRCLTHDLWEELGNQIYLYLSSVTLADVVSRQVLGTSGLIRSEDPRPQAAAK
jgi:Rrf2 family iron-sulfur cluster assembly transcriptional regulator